MIRTRIIILLIGILLISCQAVSVTSTPEITLLPATATPDIVSLTRTAIEDVVGKQRVQVNWVSINGDTIFAVNYLTDLDPNNDPEAFFEEFNQTTLIASTFFSQADMQAEALIVMAEDQNSPTTQENPPLYEVVVDKNLIASWVGGKISENVFINSWFVVPLPDQ